jgi:hypothetical protein
MTRIPRSEFDPDQTWYVLSVDEDGEPDFERQDGPMTREEAVAWRNRWIGERLEIVKDDKLAEEHQFREPWAVAEAQRRKVCGER